MARACSAAIWMGRQRQSGWESGVAALAHQARGRKGPQARFVDEYLIDLNATQAAIRAGYSARTARSTGPENLSKPVIAAAIAKGRLKQAERAELTGDMVIAELRILAFSNPEVGQTSGREANPGRRVCGSSGPRNLRHPTSPLYPVKPFAARRDHRPPSTPSQWLKPTLNRPSWPASGRLRRPGSGHSDMPAEPLI